MPAETATELRTAGAHVAVARGLDEAVATLQGWGLLLAEKTK